MRTSDLQGIDQRSRTNMFDVAGIRGEMEKLARPEFIDIVQLSPFNNTFIGKYRYGAEHIVMACDPTFGAFSVLLPWAKDTRTVILIFKEIAGLTTAITLQAQAGETIDGTATKVNTTAWGTFNLISNRKDSYYIAG